MEVKSQTLQAVKRAHIDRQVMGGSPKFTQKILGFPCNFPGFRFNVVDVREVKDNRQAIDKV